MTKVQVSLDDAAFSRPLSAAIDNATGTWSADLGEATIGTHTLYAHPVRSCGPGQSQVQGLERRLHGRPEGQRAMADRQARHGRTDIGLEDSHGGNAWSFSFKASSYGHGKRVLLVRLEQGLVACDLLRPDACGAGCATLTCPPHGPVV